MPTVLNTIYRGSFCTDKTGVNNVIEFRKRMLDTDPVPVVIPIVFAGKSPVIIEFQDKQNYKLEPVNGLSCRVDILATDTFELSSLYTADEREWQVSVTGSESFIGWLIPDSCNEPFASKPYLVSIQAVDAIGTLNDVPFEQENGVKYKGFKSDIELLQICLSKTGLSIPLLTGINTYEVTMNKALGPLQQTFRDTARYLDSDGNPFSCYEVLRSILVHWSCRLHQSNGFWQIVNVLEKSKGNVKAWKYLPNGTPDGFITLGNSIFAGGFGTDVQPASANNELAKAFKLSTAYYQYGYPSNALLNGDFDDAVPPALPNHWIAADGGAGHSETRIDQTTGLPTSDHFLVIDSAGGGNGFIYNNTSVQVRANQKVVISFDLEAKTAFTSTIGTYRYLGIRLSDNFGKFYTAENGWQNTGAFYVIQYRATELQNAIRVSFELVQQPNDYQLTIGIQAITSAISTDFVTKINNVSVQPQTVSGQTAPPLGVFNRLTQKVKQSYKKDPILLLHGDEPNEQRTSRISIGSGTVITPPTFWERAGINDPVSGLPERQSLLHIVADTELRVHARAYYVFSGKFIGQADLDINSLLVIDQLVPTGWIFLSGSFDIKTGNHELRFAEILINDVDYVEEISIEDYGSEKGKQGFSVGQPDSVNTPPGGSYTDLSGYAKTEDIPVKASATETQAGTNDDKFTTPFKLLGWWTNIKTLAATISGAWNFTSRPKYNGSNLITLADVPAEADTLQSVMSRGSVTNNQFETNYVSPFKFNSATSYFNGPSGGGDDILFWSRIAASDYIFTHNGILRATKAPVNNSDVVRLQELNNFKGSDNVLSKSAAYTVVLSDFGTNGNVTIYVDTTAGNVAITLPTPAVMNGYTANIIKETSDINSVVVTATINGVANDILSNQCDAGTYKSKGTAIFKF